MKLSAILFLSFALAVATALPTEDDVVPQDFAQDPSAHEISLEDTFHRKISLEDAFLQAQNMQATKGDNACLKLANDLKQVVATNVKALQGEQDKMDKGLSCKDEGQPIVKSAQESLATAKAAITTAQNALNAASTAKVDFGSENLDNLDPSKCVFFQMSSYTAAVKKREDAKKQLETAKELVTFAETELKNAEDAAKTAVLKCKCDIVTSHETALGKRNADAESANKEGWTKAEHLICVLAGKDMNACKVSSIPKVEAVKGLCKGCDSDACVTYKDSLPISLPDSPKTIDTCGGFRVISMCSGDRNVAGSVAYAVSKSNVWDKKKIYACPAGWHWMKAEPYYAYMNTYGCAQQRTHANPRYAYYNHCGWNGYTPPGASGSHSRFRFADSAINNYFQYVRGFEGERRQDEARFGTDYFAGIVCKKN